VTQIYWVAIVHEQKLVRVSADNLKTQGRGPNVVCVLKRLKDSLIGTRAEALSPNLGALAAGPENRRLVSK
jgi:hypothetical protein